MDYSPPLDLTGLSADISSKELNFRIVDTRHFQLCRHKDQAFGGSWLALTTTFLDTSFPNGIIETGCHRMIQRPGRIAMKSQPLSEFYIEHLSGINYAIDVANRATRLSFNGTHAALALIEDSSDAIERSSHFSRLNHSFSTMALIPFYGCSSYNKSKCSGWKADRPAIVRENYLAATVYSSLALFHQVVVGVCGGADFETVTRVLGWRNTKIFAIAILNCTTTPVFLPDILLRYAKEQLFSGAWKAQIIFYTDADHVIHIKDFPYIMDHLNFSTYVVPNRLNGGYQPLGSKMYFDFHKKNRIKHGLCSRMVYVARKRWLLCHVCERIDH